MKKILLGLLGLIVLLVVGFFALGLIYPTVSYQTKIEINKPLDVSWNYFAEPKNMKDWMLNFKSIETISGEPNTVGSKYKISFGDGGNEIVFIETMTEYKPKETVAFKLEHTMMTDDIKMKFSEENGKTILIQDDSIAGSNIFWRSLSVLMKSSFSDSAKTNLTNLKTQIENIKP